MEKIPREPKMIQKLQKIPKEFQKIKELEAPCITSAPKKQAKPYIG